MGNNSGVLLGMDHIARLGTQEDRCSLWDTVRLARCVPDRQLQYTEWRSTYWDTNFQLGKIDRWRQLR